MYLAMKIKDITLGSTTTTNRCMHIGICACGQKGKAWESDRKTVTVPTSSISSLPTLRARWLVYNHGEKVEGRTASLLKNLKRT